MSATDDEKITTGDQDAPGYRVVVHRWDVRGPLPAELVDEIHRAHRLRNDLVEVERRHADAVAAVWAAHPEVAEAETALEVADSRTAAASEAVVKSKVANRGKADPEAAAELRAARADRKAARAALRAAKEAAYPTLQPAMVEARQARRQAIKDLYRPHVDAGLYWASYKLVTDHHETAARQVAAKRKQGRPAEMRFRRWTGEGTIAVQLQRQAGKPQRTPELLCSESSPWRNVARLDQYPSADDQAAMSRADWRRHARRGVTRLTIRYGSGDAAGWATLPVAVGRPLPPDADVVGMQVTRRVVGGKERASVSVTMRVAPIAPSEGGAVGVHLGWRTMTDGSIRAAVVEGSRQPPAELVDMGVACWWGTWGEVRVPASWVAEDRRLAEVASQRDRSHNIAREKLVSWLSAEPEPPAVAWRDDTEPEPLEAHRVRQWRSPARLAQLMLRARAGAVVLPSDLLADLEAWRRQDRHLWQWHAHGTDQLAARRLDAWRKVARWVTADAAVVGVDEWAVSDLIARPDVAAERDHQADAARRAARLAAPGQLRAQIDRAAQAAGATVRRVTAEGVHRGCGGRLGGDAARRSHLVECQTCGTMVDQDRNAVLSVRQMAREAE